MDTAYLRTFLLVVDAGSMSEAARRLQVTPAAVAHQLRLVEQELGARLLARAGRTVAPTEAGHRLVERLRPLLRDLGQLRDAVGDASAGRELRLGAINTALHSLMPEILAGFFKACPDVRIDVRSGTTAGLYDSLLRGDIDVAVCLHPAFALPKTIRWEPLREEPLVVMAPARWARRDAHALLRDEPYLRYDPALGGGRQADDYLRKAGIVPRERMVLSSLPAIAMMVDRGLGVSLAPDASVPWLRGLRVARLEVDQPYRRRFGVLWPRSSARTRLIQALVDAARTAVDQPPLPGTSRGGGPS